MNRVRSTEKNVKRKSKRKNGGLPKKEMKVNNHTEKRKDVRLEKQERRKETKREEPNIVNMSLGGCGPLCVYLAVACIPCSR